MTPATGAEAHGAAERSSGPDHQEDFLDFLARRLGIEPAEARNKLSDFLAHYEPESRPRP